jgi:putative membrane protein
MSLSVAAAAFVAALHAVFFVMESLLWMSPKVMEIFGNTAESASATRVMALNQGFYNLGAAALLVFFLVTANTAGVMGVLLYLFAMGIVGAVTANWRIILVQSLPALVALALVYRG